MLAGVCLLMTYQNCAQTPEDDGSNSQASYQESLPFAYEEKLDTIGYMSCSEIKDSVDRRAYFSYRVGAFNKSVAGLTMTDDFRSKTQYYTKTDRARALASSYANSGAVLNLSVRLRSNLQSIWSQGELRVGDEIDSFLPALDSTPVAGPLASLAAPSAGGTKFYANYFPGTQQKRLMEASLRFYEFENVSKDTRSNLEGAGSPAYLTVGYGNSGDELATGLRAPSDNTLASRGYGTGFALSFSLPRNYSSGERRVLNPNSGVQEIDLRTGQPRAASWDCSNSYQFMVVRPEDKFANLVTCNATVDRFANATEEAALNAVRRVLRVEDWFVDVANRCVIPKRTGDYCYGALNGATITYGSANCVNSGATRCPHFVSVCIRR
ncbi:MAG: hypothetical protein KF799_01785 [Bdellovibrionales bacterium]|nr:hypothetical protein [Bdellovibrionales bacterium]